MLRIVLFPTRKTSMSLEIHRRAVPGLLASLRWGEMALMPMRPRGGRGSVS